MFADRLAVAEASFRADSEIIVDGRVAVGGLSAWGSDSGCVSALSPDFFDRRFFLAPMPQWQPNFNMRTMVR